jgi:hypothetical protein
VTGIQVDGFDLEGFRARLRKMSDEKLVEYGEAARYMNSPQANFGEPPLPIHAIQLEETIAEWRRRHPKKENP